ncbi:hypothetical protein [Methylophaga pinxianii]|uniref:hypothetical protein n=1 Tax=Methylophaga pinxianii TaxID=2881052 RepID=UPI001FFA4D9F|nr:hypothetical protein [Methylophaga pinxianii]MCB2425577.1 hypothetical protein [Methylophaga pinxianii]UPH45029.1 hypothetical protein LGT42_010960 [Methylophaga pinxianii]
MLLAKSDPHSKSELETDPLTSLHGRIDFWQKSSHSNNALRVILWMYLREAFSVPAQTFASYRSAMTACDDVVATALLSLKPGFFARIKQPLSEEEIYEPATLDSLARTTLDEMLSNVLNGQDPQSEKAREAMLSETRKQLENLDPISRSKLLDAVGADSINDAAIRNILLTGGGLAAFGTSVSMAGFSAYILAAQASAFIPLVSGPALVSFVAVLSNPITIIGTTLGIGWWVTHATNDKVRFAVGVRVLSLLSLYGLQGREDGIRIMLNAFSELKHLHQAGDLNNKVLKRYQSDWECIEHARKDIFELNPNVATIMAHNAGTKSKAEGVLEFLNADELERRNAAILTLMTLGDITYNAFNIDPSVLEAADFARSEVLNDPIAFAAFAERIESMAPNAHLGSINNIKGYVSERVAASQLVANGHIVQFPETSNEAGWDISVDGIKFQVKDVSDLYALQNHFDKGYDYPVIANAEIAVQLSEQTDSDLPEWSDKIHFVEGYSNEVVEHVTRTSIQSGDGILNPDIPLFALMLTGIRNLSRMRRGEVAGNQAFQEILLEGSTRAGLAAAGGYAGSSIGLLVFGPAGALVMGGVIPILSQMQSSRLRGEMDKWIQGSPYLHWSTEFRIAVDKLITKAEGVIKSKAEEMKERRNRVSGDDVASEYVRWRLSQDICFLREAWYRLRAIRKDASPVETVSINLMNWLSKSTIHPAAYQAELKNLSVVFHNRPSVADRLTDASTKAYQSTEKWLGNTLRNFSNKKSGL